MVTSLVVIVGLIVITLFVAGTASQFLIETEERQTDIVSGVISGIVSSTKEQELCLQVFTDGCNPVTNEIRQFSTACLPEGWTSDLSQCIITTTTVDILFCGQSFTDACNPSTGELATFPTTCLPGGWTTDLSQCEVLCGQLFTDACNPTTGIIQTFPTTCLPEGWTTDLSQCGG